MKDASGKRSPSADSADGGIGVVVAMATELLRRGVSSALSEETDLVVLETVDRAERVLRAVRTHAPDVLVLDTDFQREDPGLVAEVATARPDCGIVVLVNHTDDECTIRSLLSDPEGPGFSDDALARLGECCLLAFRSSARGCVPKQADAERLRATVRTVAAGDVATGPWLSAAMRLEHGSGAAAGRNATVSARELDVIALVARGLENKEIAEELGIREQTVKNHVTRVMRKLGLRNRQEVVLFAVRTHLAPDRFAFGARRDR
jgi:DNA-binding NarL/FixJ family response regulator